METYKHFVQYYETDRMGVTHHSNYIRWMEEARGYFMHQVGWDYEKFEEIGLVSPVVEMNCKYITTTTFADVVSIDVKVTDFKGVKLCVEYVMTKEDGTKVLTGSSVHCFINKEGRPVNMARQFPEFVKAMNEAFSKEEN